MWQIRMIFVIFTGIYLLVLAVMDMVEHKVTIGSLVFGLSVIVLSFIPSLCPSDMAADLPSRLLGLIPGVIMILCSRITNGQIGIGDGILCAVLGVAIGFRSVCSILMTALLLIAAYSVALLACGRFRRNRQIAFIPFIFIGFLLLRIGA